MLDISFANANTAIRLKELDFITKDSLEALLKAQSFEQALQLLRSTVYFDLDTNYNEQLLHKLTETYAFIEAISPDERIVQIFSLMYSYHNLKVILKEKLCQLSISHLLIPIGKIKNEQLIHAVETNENNGLNPILFNGIQEVKANYESFGEVEAIDVIMDRTYFNHLFDIATQINDESVLHLIKCWIDLFNVSVLMRSQRQKASRGFLTSIMADNGEILKNDLLQLNGQVTSNKINQLFKITSYGHRIEQFVSDEHRFESIETLKDVMTNEFMKDAKFEAFGFMPLLSFIFYKEMEITNLRLILTGKDNGMPEKVLRERVKPIYVS